MRPRLTAINKRRLRFGFQILDGPAKGLSCLGWRVWTHREDTYVTAKSLGDTRKVSLHGDEWWTSAVTKENSLSPDTVLAFLDPCGDSSRPPSSTVGASPSSLPSTATHFDQSRRPPAAGEAIIEVPDRWDALTLAAVRMTEPGVGLHPDWSMVGSPLPLLSGRNVWVWLPTSLSADRTTPVPRSRPTRTDPEIGAAGTDVMSETGRHRFPARNGRPARGTYGLVVRPRTRRRGRVSKVPRHLQRLRLGPPEVGGCAGRLGGGSALDGWVWSG